MAVEHTLEFNFKRSAISLAVSIIAMSMQLCEMQMLIVKQYWICMTVHEIVIRSIHWMLHASSISSFRQPENIDTIINLPTRQLTNDTQHEQNWTMKRIQNTLQRIN